MELEEVNVCQMERVKLCTENYFQPFKTVLQTMENKK